MFVITKCLFINRSSSITSLVPRKKSYSIISSSGSLQERDPEVFNITKKEYERQRDTIQLIASENLTSTAVREAVSSFLMHKYSEGYPGARYYAGNQFIDENESLCRKRALEVFGLDPEKWGVNVQALSGSPANFAAYTALLSPHDRIMGLDLPHGGHLTHGYMTPVKRISATSIFFESMPYRLNSTTGRIDYENLESSAKLFRPKMIIAGYSAHSRHYNYAEMRRIADINGSYLLSDIAHISGLVVAGLAPNPFDHSDIVTTTTHKTLRGPRGGLIFYRRGLKKSVKGKDIFYDYEDKINGAVFPALQGGPHNHTIAGISVALKEAGSQDFKDYQKQVLSNSKKLGETLLSLGFQLVSGGTDNHLILVDLRQQDIDGARVDAVMEKCNIICNKNAVPGDTKPFVPGGIRLGSPYMTSRGLKEDDFVQIAKFIQSAINETVIINKKLLGENKTKLNEFKEHLDSTSYPSLSKISSEVTNFCRKFPMPK